MFGFGGIDIFFVLFFIVFAVMLGVFVYSIVKSIANNRKNHASPILDVSAKVVCKRSSYSGDTTNFDAHHTMHTSSGVTRYWVTFQFPSGDRSEFAVTGQEYGLLAEGDEGMLRFRGNEYLSFERNRS